MIEVTYVEWIDNSYTPFPICWLELEDGTQIQGRYAVGDWETMDGQWIKPQTIVKWKPLRIQGLKGKYD